MSIAVNHMMLPVYFRSLLPISRRYWSCRDAHLRDHYWSKICLLQSRCVCSWSKRQKQSLMRAGLIIDWQNQLSSSSISKATNVAGWDRVVDRVFFNCNKESVMPQVAALHALLPYASNDSAKKIADFNGSKALAIPTYVKTALQLKCASRNVLEKMTETESTMAGERLMIEINSIEREFWWIKILALNLG
jgi:hypothetical protein